MYIGSVRFYRHLILCILGIIMIGLLTSTIYLGVSKLNTATQVKSLKDENAAISQQLEALKNPDPSQTPDNDQNKDSSGKNSDNSKDLPAYCSMYPEMVIAPIAPKPAEERKNTAYLSFDDGPSVQTPLVLDTLKQYDIKATFFIVSKNINPQNTQYLQRMVEEGHAIGVHSDSHVYEEIYASVDAYLEDFYQAWQKIYEATGIKTNIYRFPGGSINSHNKQVFQAIITEMTRRGFTYYDWNVDSADALKATKSADTIFNQVNATFAKFDEPVILMHDEASKQYTPPALPKIIEAIKAAGYTFGTLDKRDSVFYPYSAVDRI